jgi:hypothetical protein
MTKNLAIFVGVGVVVVAIALGVILYGTKGSHLEIKSEIMKIRTGVIDEHNVAAVLDLRLENLSDVPFVVREVTVTAEQPNGEKVDGNIISKSDFKQLLEYNKFLGKQFNEGLSARDKVPPHQKVDRMIAVRFEIPQADLEKAKQIRLWIQDMDGAEFETTKALQ